MKITKYQVEEGGKRGEKRNSSPTRRGADAGAICPRWAWTTTCSLAPIVGVNSSHSPSGLCILFYYKHTNTNTHSVEIAIEPKKEKKEKKRSPRRINPRHTRRNYLHTIYANLLHLNYLLKYIS